MKTTPIKGGWSIDTAVRRKPRINPQPQYQRTPVWKKPKKQLLIDSLLRGYDLPKFYLRSSDSGYEYEVVDGQQRLIAIWGFHDNQYALGDKSTNIPDFGDLSCKKFSELPSDAQDRFGEFRLTLIKIEEASDLEIRQLFLRLQEGVSLNPAEKRNAMPGNMRDFIADLGDKHKVFHSIRIPDTRFQWHDLAAIVTRLELEKGPTDVKSENLTDMYENGQNFNKDGSVAKKVRRHLNYMQRILNNEKLAMKIKWGFIDLYLLISKMDEIYVIKDREDDFAQFYIRFEIDRLKAIRNPSDLLSSSKSPWNKQLYTYIEAFKNEGGTRRRIERRHAVYVKQFLRNVQNLIPKDSRRAFTDDERYIIWYRSNGECQNKDCNKSISIDQKHADHIIPHSQGGKTTIDNSQGLCQQCNASKGAN